MAMSGQDHVLPGVAHQVIVVGSPVERVVAATTQQGVTSCVSGQLIIPTGPVESIVSSRTTQRVLTSGSDQFVVPVSAVEMIISIIALQRVISGSTGQLIVSTSTRQEVAAFSAIDGVRTPLSVDHINPVATNQRVIQAAAGDRVITSAAVDINPSGSQIPTTGVNRVGPSLAIDGQHHCRNRGYGSDGDRVATGSGINNDLGHRVPDRDRATAIGHLQLGRRILQKFNLVVPTVSLHEHRIGVFSTIQLVGTVSKPPDQLVVARFAKQGINSTLALQDVVTVPTPNHVVSTTTINHIVSIASPQHIGATAAVEQVLGACPNEGVLAAPTQQCLARQGRTAGCPRVTRATTTCHSDVQLVGLHHVLGTGDTSVVNATAAQELVGDQFGFPETTGTGTRQEGAAIRANQFQGQIILDRRVKTAGGSPLGALRVGRSHRRQADRRGSARNRREPKHIRVGCTVDTDKVDLGQSHRHVDPAIAIAVDQSRGVRAQGHRGIVDQAEV